MRPTPMGVVEGETVTVLSAGTVTDPYSDDPAESWDEDDITTRDVTTIAPLEPRPSDEPVQDARNAISNGWTVYLPAGDPVGRENRLRIRGEDYPVQGRPSDWGVGVVVQAFRTEG